MIHHMHNPYIYPLINCIIKYYINNYLYHRYCGTIFSDITFLISFFAYAGIGRLNRRAKAKLDRLYIIMYTYSSSICNVSTLYSPSLQSRDHLQYVPYLFVTAQRTKSR